jgi:GntR family transcriptional regulator
MTLHIDPAGDRAVYRQIADHLRAEIECGTRGPGTQLPSESRLMADYAVSRVTARRALGVLATDGLVTAEHGRGWFVRRKPPVRRLRSDMQTSDRPLRVEVLYVGRGVAPAETVSLLGIEPGDEVVVRRRRYFTEDQPIEVATSYIPLAGAEGATFDRYDEEVAARMPTEQESRLLQLAPTSPVLHLVRTTTAGGRPVEVCDTVMDASAFVLHYSVPAHLP